MDSKGRAVVCWVYAPEDTQIVRELIVRARVLEAQGLVENYLFTTTASGAPRIAHVANSTTASIDVLRRADIAMFLCSQTPVLQRYIKIAAENSHTRMIPVILTAAALPPELAAVQSLPRDEQPIMARRDRE